MKRSGILLIDAVINLVLGLILICYTKDFGTTLGIPLSGQYFYIRIFGAVLIGIAIALVIEYCRKPDGLTGLGLGGAVAINLCGGIALALLLVFGNLSLPLRGLIILWFLVAILVVVSCVEIILYYNRKIKNL